MTIVAVVRDFVSFFFFFYFRQIPVRSVRAGVSRQRADVPLHVLRPPGPPAEAAPQVDQDEQGVRTIRGADLRLALRIHSGG